MRMVNVIVPKRKEETIRLIDADAIQLPKGFFENVDNVPKFYEWLNSLPTVPAAPRWVRCEDELPKQNIQCLVTDAEGNCAVGYYRNDAKAWDSPFFGWVERSNEDYYEDGDLCRIGKVVAWMPIEPPKEGE